MTSGPDDKPDIAALIETIAGAAASDDGHSIKLGVVSSEGIKADLIMSTDRAADLMTQVSDAMGKAARNRTNDPDMLYILPAKRLQAHETPDPHTLVLAFLLAGGAELCFRIDRAEARQVHEILGVLLGLSGTAPIPKSQKH